MTLVKRMQEHMMKTYVKYINRPEVKEDSLKNNKIKERPLEKEAERTSPQRTTDIRCRRTVLMSIVHFVEAVPKPRTLIPINKMVKYNSGEEESVSPTKE